MENMLLVVLLGIGLFFVYFLPTILAYGGKKAHRDAILFINLFLGWLVIGWIAALIWACVASRKEKLGFV